MKKESPAEGMIWFPHPPICVIDRAKPEEIRQVSSVEAAAEELLKWPKTEKRDRAATLLTDAMAGMADIANTKKAFEAAAKEARVWLPYGNPREEYPPIDSEAARETLWSLIRLAGYETELIGNPNGEIEKDAKAREALVLAGRLIGPLVRWAINHEVGQILAKIGPAVPWRPHRIANSEKYEARTRKRNLLANSHDNERRGAAYPGGDPKTDRKVAAAVVGLISSGMSFNPGRRLAASLQALEQGEVTKMLAPGRKGRMGSPASLDAIRLNAVKHVYFLRGEGRKKTEALEEVANALGVTLDTVDMWDNRLHLIMGQEFVEENLEDARAVGRLASAVKDVSLQREVAGIFSMSFHNSADLEHAKARVDLYSSKHLAALGVRYRELSREKPIKVRLKPKGSRKKPRKARAL